MTMLLNPGTCCGSVWALVSIVPLPISPEAFAPHSQMVPSASRASEWLSPPETETTLLRTTTCTGTTLRLLVVPMPSSPYVLSPHVQAVPSDLTARQCAQPQEIATTFDKPPTSTGTARLFVVPSPTCPELLLPQHQTVPLLINAML